MREMAMRYAIDSFQLCKELRDFVWERLKLDVVALCEPSCVLNVVFVPRSLRSQGVDHRQSLVSGCDLETLGDSLINPIRETDYLYLIIITEFF